MVDRRQFLKGAGAATTIGVTGLSGCLDSITGGTETRQEWGDGTLDFYMSPSEPQDLMMSQYEPVKERLTNQITDTSLTYAKNYSAVIESLGTGTGDVAETGPFAAALGVNDDKAEIILQRYAYGGWDYTSTLTAQSDSDISSVSDLEGKTIALADRLSASGSLYPLDTLKNAGLSIGDLPTGSDANADFTVQYAGGHAQAFEALVNGQVDAAGVGEFITLNDDREPKDGIKYVEKREGIPRAPIVVSPKLTDENKQAVIDAFVNAGDKLYAGADGESGTDDDLWFSDVRERGVDTYQEVINIAQSLGIELSDIPTPEPTDTATSTSSN